MLKSVAKQRVGVTSEGVYGILGGPLGGKMSPTQPFG